jgi:hypothetical protein
MALNVANAPFSARYNLQKMKKIFIILFFAYGAVNADYTIESKDGRSLEIKDPHFDGNLLKVTRTSDGRTVKISPSILTIESWEKLNHDTTQKMGVSLTAKPLSISRNTEKPWSTNYGSYEKKEGVMREFDVRVSSSSHFKKKIRVECYFVKGDRFSVERREHIITFTSPLHFQTSGEARKETLHLAALGQHYEIGDDLKTDFVILVRHSNGNVAELYSTRKSAADLIMKYLKKTTE